MIETVGLRLANGGGHNSGGILGHLLEQRIDGLRVEASRL